MKNKFLSLMLVASLALTACGNNDNAKDNSDTSEDTKVEESVEESKDSSEDTEAKEEADEKPAEEEKADDKEKEADENTEDEANDEGEEDADSKEAEVVSGRVTQNFDLSAHQANESVRLWVPYAQSDDYQTISNEEIKVDENVATASIEEDELGNKMIYVEFDPEASEKKLSYSFDVSRKEVLRPEIKEEEEDFDKAEFEEYLSDSSLLNINGPVKDKAMEITEGKETVEEKAKAIYDWIYENMVRDNDVVGCGLGDVDDLLEVKAGKCTDIGSVFVAMARSVGIPARETFGVRLSKDDTADITKAQHCWVEYYQPGTGWFAIDVADVLKACLNDGLEKDSKEALDLKDYYYGNLDAVRVGFTTGRDLDLSPKQAGEKLNQFGYPYAEVDGNALEFYSPDTFIYEFSFEKEK